MAGPWEKYQTGQPHGGIVTKPADPAASFKTHRERNQSVASDLDPARAAEDLRASKLRNEQLERELSETRAGTGAGQSREIGDLVQLRKEFEGNEAVQKYKTVLPLITKAMTADPNSGAGDLSVIYSFGKVMDPGSVVREGEMVMAGSTTPLSQLAEQWRLRVEKGQRMPPNVRKALVNEMRKAGGDMNTRFMQERARYGATAKKLGIDPEDVIGPHPGKAFQQIEADFLGRPVRNADGSRGAAPRKQARQKGIPPGWIIEEDR